MLIATQVIRCSDGVWIVCWFDVITQMVAVPMPMLHSNGGNWLGAAVESIGAKVSCRLKTVI